jgi:hypothetical protein
MLPSPLSSAFNDFRALKHRLFRQRLSASPAEVDLHAIQKHIDQLEAKLVEAEDLQRAAAATQGSFVPMIKSFDGKSQLNVSVMSPSAPWLGLAPGQCATPAMISTEEAQYYRYIGAFYAGLGRALELGPWLGASTQHIVESLAHNPNFRGQKLHVVDDFVWRAEWMNRYVLDEEKLPNHVSFRHLFEKYTGEIRDLLAVQQARLTIYDGNENVQPFSWDQGPIEFLYVDCGRTLAANDAWFKYLRPAFIPGRTLLMMQDWRLHRERPRKWFNQTRLFTDSKEGELRLLHEVSNGGLATFLFNG